MPVPLLMTIAPKSGAQPCVRRGATRGFRRVKRPQESADRTTRTAMVKGIGVCRKMMSTEETAPRRMSVTRSPRQEAMGGAMLSASDYE